jgi:Helix-turn-helix domain
LTTEYILKTAMPTSEGGKDMGHRKGRPHGRKRQAAKVLTHPVRRDIVQRLSHGQGLSPASIADRRRGGLDRALYHLGVLLRATMIAEKGDQGVYALTKAGRASFEATVT